MAREMEKTARFSKGAKMTANVKMISLRVHGDDRGKLVALEKGHNLPFDVKRVYYIYGAKAGVPRGFHAHKHLKQLLIATSGSVEIHCEMCGQRSVYILNKPDEALLIEGMVWRTMEKFSSDCVLTVLADKAYNEADYIRNYTDFLKEENHGK